MGSTSATVVVGVGVGVGVGDVVVVPSAASMAVLASTMPTPHWAQATGKPRAAALLFRRVSTWSGVSAALRASISATMPATWGVAMDVPR